MDNIAECGGPTLFLKTVNGRSTKELAPLYFDKGTYLIHKGDKIAQLVVQPIPQTVAVEIAELGESDRGANGFGSSGV